MTPPEVSGTTTSGKARFRCKWRISAALFDVPQPGIEHFLHTSKLGAPQVAHVVEALVDGLDLQRTGGTPGVILSKVWPQPAFGSAMIRVWSRCTSA